MEVSPAVPVEMYCAGGNDPIKAAAVAEDNSAAVRAF